MLSIHFRASWPDGTFLFDVGSGVHVEASRFPGLETSALKIMEIVHRSLKDFDWFLYDQALELDEYLQLDEYLHGWLSNVARTFAEFAIYPTRTAPLDERVEQGLRWLNSLPLNAKFLEKQLASHLGLSVGHLNRLFSRELGKSAVDILERRRLERAFHLLHYSSTPVKQMAYDLGFCSPSHFTSWFRARTGKTPLQFRQFPGHA